MTRLTRGVRASQWRDVSPSTGSCPPTRTDAGIAGTADRDCELRKCHARRAAPTATTNFAPALNGGSCSDPPRPLHSQAELRHLRLFRPAQLAPVPADRQVGREAALAPSCGRALPALAQGRARCCGSTPVPTSSPSTGTTYYGSAARSSSAMSRRRCSAPAQGPIAPAPSAKALVEYGKVLRALHALRWFTDEASRRRIGCQFNRGEACDHWLNGMRSTPGSRPTCSISPLKIPPALRAASSVPPCAPRPGDAGAGRWRGRVTGP